MDEKTPILMCESQIIRIFASEMTNQNKMK